MSQVLGQLPDITDPNVLVGAAKGDDAGVYRISDDLAVVLSVDFFTPIVDDPYQFGAIAAANSLSDIWAMGGRAVVSLNVAALPDKPEMRPVVSQIFQGGIDKMLEAGVPIIGGHTIKDAEPKFGYFVMGLIHPDHLLDNSKARHEDSLVVTKKIGTGIVSTGIKRSMCSKEVEEEVSASMSELNKRAAEIMMDVGVSTATDITGFGLMGHLTEVLEASGLRARLKAESVPYFNEAIKLAKDNIAPGGSIGNMRTYSRHTRFTDQVEDHLKLLLNDAQTSGGLLMFVPSGKRDELMSRLGKEGIAAAHIGEVTKDKVTEDDRLVLVEA